MSEIFYFDTEEESDMFCAVVELLEPCAEITILYPAFEGENWTVGITSNLSSVSLYRLLTIATWILKRWSNNPGFKFTNN